MRLLILILFPILSFAQDTKPLKKWYSFDISDAGMALCGAVGGGNRGLNQAILFRNYGKDDPFWDLSLGSKRKYKDFDNGDLSAAFPGSKTVFVGFTDGYHGTNMGQTMCYVGGALIIGFDMLKNYDRPALAMLKKLALFFIANGIAFKIAYK